MAQGLSGRVWSATPPPILLAIPFQLSSFDLDSRVLSSAQVTACAATKITQRTAHRLNDRISNSDTIQSGHHFLEGDTSPFKNDVLDIMFQKAPSHSTATTRAGCSKESATDLSPLRSAPGPSTWKESQMLVGPRWTCPESGN